MLISKCSASQNISDGKHLFKMLLRNALVVGAVILCISIDLSHADPLDTCETQQPCLRFGESGCIGGSRTVCLSTSQSAIGGCTLGMGANTAVNNMCTIDAAGNPMSSVQNSLGPTCGVFAGESTARFAISDTAAGSGLIAEASVLIVGGNSGSKSGTCAAESTRRCPNAGADNTIWSFAVTSCTCNCSDWTAFSSCGTNCMKSKTRSCDTPTGLTCPTQETVSCNDGSDCTATTTTATTTTTTTPTTTTATTTTTTPAPPGCSCTMWSPISSCTGSCGTGTQPWSRTCTNCNTPPPLIELRECALEPCTTTPEPCTCSKYTTRGTCSRPCGPGTRRLTRTCSSGCPSNILLTSSERCKVKPCSRKTRNCKHLETPKKRKRCRRNNKNNKHKRSNKHKRNNRLG